MKKEVILTIKEDISTCENYPCANGSYQLLNQLLAKYSVLYKDFNKTINISYKSVPIHGEPDYRPELQLVAEKLKMMLQLENSNELSPTCSAKAKTLFISHRNCDKQFADILADFCALIGIPSNEIFCSSLPGNDVQHKIDDEIKINLQNSKINIILLSKDYFDSVYCLNEEGIIWYLDSQSIPFLLFALPEITEKELKGFIDKNYKIQRIDNESDLMMTFDILKNHYNLTLPIAKINDVVKKTIKQSQSLLAERTISPQEKIKSDKIDFNNLTDDELIVLFYVIENRKIQINLDKINNWMLTSEIYGIDIENAFNLLERCGIGKFKDDYFELDISFFRQITSQQLEIPALKEKIKQHYKPSSELLNILWKKSELTDIDKLFVSYVRDERITTFGDRWEADKQIKDIKQWESKNILDSTLSNNYGKALQFFIDNNFVYPSSYTNFGNPREYTLHNTIKDLLFNSQFLFDDDIENTKKCHPADELPF